MDAGFLRQAYFTLVWFGTLLALLIFAGTRSILVTWSFVAGMMLAALLLKSQEFFAARLLAARNKNLPQPTGLVARIPLGILVPAKYLLVGALLWLLLRYQWMQPVPFMLGFLVLKVVIVSKVLGQLIHSRMRPIADVYVQPHISQGKTHVR